MSYEPPIYINVHEAKTHLSKYLHMVEEGREVLIKRNQKAVARLSAASPVPQKPRKLGMFKGHVPDSFFDPMTEDELALWYDAPISTGH